MNERLENDLLSMNKHGNKSDEAAGAGDAGTASGDVDILANLDFGKKSNSVGLVTLGLRIKYSFGLLILGFSGKDDSSPFYFIC